MDWAATVDATERFPAGQGPAGVGGEGGGGGAVPGAYNGHRNVPGFRDQNTVKATASVCFLCPESTWVHKYRGTRSFHHLGCRLQEANLNELESWDRSLVLLVCRAWGWLGFGTLGCRGSASPGT